MNKAILKLGLIQKLPFFQNYNRAYVVPTANLVSFLCQIGIVALLYLLIEKPIEELTQGGILAFLKLYVEEGIYFVMTTATTVGYGDLSPTTLAGKLFVMCVIFVFIAVRFVSVITDFTSAKSNIKDLIKNGRIVKTMKNHIIIYGDADTIKNEDFIWLKQFVSEMKKSTKYRDNDLLLVNHNEETNTRLNEFMNATYCEQDGVKHLNATLGEDDFFERIFIEEAEHIFILGNPEDMHSDSVALDFAIRVEEETNYNKDVTAEVVNDRNRDRLVNRAGVDVVVRPDRAYPSLLVTASIARGSAQVLEEIISRGADSLEFLELKQEQSFRFVDLLCEMSLKGLGTAVAIIYEDRVDPNPHGEDIIKNPTGVITMIHEMRTKQYESLQSQLFDIQENVSKK